MTNETTISSEPLRRHVPTLREQLAREEENALKHLEHIRLVRERAEQYGILDLPNNHFEPYGF